MFRRGQKVTLKTNKSVPEKIGRIVCGPPVIIGDPNNPHGIFPIEVPNYVIVSWSNNPNSMEKLSDITIVNRRSTK